MSLTSMHHTGLTVSDLTVSTRFYERLGFTRSFEEPLALEEDWAETVIGLAKPSLLVMFLTLGEARLEVVAGVKLAAGDGDRAVSHVQQDGLVVARGDVARQVGRRVGQRDAAQVDAAHADMWIDPVAID